MTRLIDRLAALTVNSDKGLLDDLCRHIHAIDPNRPCNGSNRAYLHSIDDAKTLVDSRALWAVGCMEDGPFARLCWPQPGGSFVGGYFEVYAATPAIALCIAALKARTPS